MRVLVIPTQFSYLHPSGAKQRRKDERQKQRAIKSGMMQFIAKEYR
jgi:hypothetical protein